MSENVTLSTGESVTVRGVTGYEVMLSRKKDEIGQNVFLLSCAMGISEAAALEWFKTKLAGDFTAVMDKIQELSRMKTSADVDAYKSADGESGD